MQSLLGLLALTLALPAFGSVVDVDTDVDGHHHHHGHHHHKHGAKKDSTLPPKLNDGKKDGSTVTADPKDAKATVHASVNIVDKMKQIEARIKAKTEEQAKAKQAELTRTEGHLLVNGPVPVDFAERFAQAVGFATGSDPSTIKVLGSHPVEENPGVVEIAFVASPKVVKDVETEAADPESKLAQGNMHAFLVAKGDDAEKSGPEEQAPKESKKQSTKEEKDEKEDKVPSLPPLTAEVTPVEEKGIDIDTAMPYGDLEPFGREDTAQELTESSVKESDEMVDQLERAEVAEEKRAVFRALTRLRGAAITSFDGVARSQTGNIDEYNKVHKWRNTHPLHHLADEESDVAKWAFPDNADFLQTKKRL
jgi:hypothetical protein